MIWTTNRNGEPSTRNITANVNRFRMSHNAECTALRATIMATAAPTEITAGTQKRTRSTAISPAPSPGPSPGHRAGPAAAP
jgi:hypothetical protein